MKFSVLGSGSSGNSTYVETDRARILIDAGLSARETTRRLATLDRQIEDVDAICISHEHEDHARGLDVLTRKHKLTVIASRGTLRSIQKRLAPSTEQVELGGGAYRRFGDLDIEAFKVPHDAREPLGFRLTAADRRLGHLTDFGAIDDSMREALDDVTALVMESNHDVDMVKRGPYPYHLKRRLLGPLGHLSNEGLGEYLRTTSLDHLQVLVLAHLSRTNNRADLAQRTIDLALRAREKSLHVELAAPNCPGELRAVPRAGSGSALRQRREAVPSERMPVQLGFSFAPARAGGG